MNHIDCLKKAYRLLDLRDHSEVELRAKLTKYNFAASWIDDVIAQLQADNIINDERYANSYTRFRSGRGFGPQRIEQELLGRGLAPDLIAKALAQEELIWADIIIQCFHKKFGDGLEFEVGSRQKHYRFLQYRGFDHSLIHGILRELRYINNIEQDG